MMMKVMCLAQFLLEYFKLNPKSPKETLINTGQIHSGI